MMTMVDRGAIGSIRGGGLEVVRKATIIIAIVGYLTGTVETEGVSDEVVHIVEAHRIGENHASRIVIGANRRGAADKTMDTLAEDVLQTNGGARSRLKNLPLSTARLPLAMMLPETLQMQELRYCLLRLRKYRRLRHQMIRIK